MTCCGLYHGHQKPPPILTVAAHDDSPNNTRLPSGRRRSLSPSRSISWSISFRPFLNMLGYAYRREPVPNQPAPEEDTTGNGTASPRRDDIDLKAESALTVSRTPRFHPQRSTPLHRFSCRTDLVYFDPMFVRTTAYKRTWKLTVRFRRAFWSSPRYAA